MALPPFQDFMSTLDEKTLSGIMNDASNTEALVQNIPGLNPENLSRNQRRAESLIIALELLGCYHKWLEQSGECL